MNREKLLLIYNLLYKAFGPQNWWPGETKDEIVIGAILTQNTAWNNVEKAIAALKRAHLCDLKALHEAEPEKIKNLIKPAGFFNQKCYYLKSVSSFFVENGGFDRLNKLTTSTLRASLLTVKGVGEETADSILLYVFNRPVFVIDTYTKRLLSRHGGNKISSYKQAQALFMNNINPDVKIYNEYHALIVKLGKEFCKPTPTCQGCPLEGLP